MCIPLVAAAALAGVGGVAKYLGEKKAQKAQDRVQQVERARQQRMTEEQQGYLDKSLASAGDVVDPAAIAAAKGARENALFAAMAPEGAAGIYLPGQASAPAIVQQQEGRAVDGARTEARSLASALAALGGTGDQMQRLNIDIGRNSQAIGQIARDKGNSADILQTELQAAAEKGALLRGLGGLAMQIGMSAATGGIGGSSAAAAGGAAKASNFSNFAKAFAKSGGF
jgi:hypothetical protein